MTEEKAKSVTPEEKKSIEGLVADILNEREVVLNIGKNNGVKVKMRFGILEYSNYEIKDPVTGEVLDHLPPRVKVKVEVVELTDRIAVARTYEVNRKNVGGLGYASLAPFRMLEPEKWVEQPVTFRIGDAGSTYHGFKELSPEESIVKIGDAVRLLTD